MENPINNKLQGGGIMKHIYIFCLAFLSTANIFAMDFSEKIKADFFYGKLYEVDIPNEKSFARKYEQQIIDLINKGEINIEFSCVEPYLGLTYSYKGTILHKVAIVGTPKIV
jgi:hypothetical protein